MTWDDYFHAGGSHGQAAQHQQQLPLILQSVRRSIVTGAAPSTPPSKKSHYVEDDMIPPIERTYSEASASSTSTSTTNGSPPSSPSRRGGANQGNGVWSVLQARAALLLRATLVASLFFTVLHMVRLQTLPARAVGEHQVRSKGEDADDGPKVHMLPASSSSSLGMEKVGQNKEVAVKSPPPINVDVDIDGHEDNDHATFPMKKQNTIATKGVQPRSFPPRIMGVHYQHTKYHPRKEFSYYFKKELLTYEHPVVATNTADTNRDSSYDPPGSLPRKEHRQNRRRCKRGRKTCVPARMSNKTYSNAAHEIYLHLREVGLAKHASDFHHSVQSRPSRCQPYATWHTMNHPTCNMIHEVDVPQGLVGSRHGGCYDGACRDRGHDGGGCHNFGAARVGRSTVRIGGEERDQMSHIDFIASGKTRQAWKMYLPAEKSPVLFSDDGHGGGRVAGPDAVVLKMLQINETYGEYMYEHQKIDALIAERLTSSSHVVNIYGYCGETAINEWGDEGNLRDYYEKTPAVEMSSMDKLIMARDAAAGLAEIHGIGVGEEEGKNLTSVIHHDLHRANFLIHTGRGGEKVIKFHDFNNAKLLFWDYNRTERCGWHFEKTCKKMKKNLLSIPEECILDKDLKTESTEVFKFGSVLRFLLLNDTENNATTNPENVAELENHDFARPPQVPEEIEESTDPATRALLHATQKAFTYEEATRPSAREIADYLDGEMLRIQFKSLG